ncbi:MAG TPA: TraR/DksA C4-type zinc finger protein [Pyrinomonadaceae bacterium]|nr:TraR/DksA C4-type zinc finger protein [Pyrinomonadaceae bacterium]
MSENRTIHLIEIPIGGKGGFIWNRLHGEREDICEALSKDGVDERNELLQARLRKIDDALDRLMSGSYGNCSNCGGAIGDERLDIDPALELCLNCWGREPDSDLSGDVALASLNAFDTIMVQTHNSVYRILLLDPKTGRALVDGGEYLVEPNEALLKGSASLGSEFKVATISVGCRLEMWIDERVFLTSPIKSVHVKHNSELESPGPQKPFLFTPGFSPVARTHIVEKPF